MVELSNDEMTVLGIVKAGGFIAPIGKWESVVLRLAERGLLEKKDEVNYVATAAGNVAYDESDDSDIRALIETNNKIASARIKSQEKIKQAAKLVWEAAKLSSAVTREDYDSSVQKWGKQVIECALELAKEQRKNNVEAMRKALESKNG